MAPTVLVVEDELKIRELLRNYLERAGLAVISTGSGADAILMHDEVRPDLVVLDLRLPDIAGETVAAEIRRKASTPIIMLTAKSSEADRIAGLELGADDYLTKPFSPRELVLRVQAVLRRSAGDPAVDERRSFGAGRVVLDDAAHEVVADGEPVSLTTTEWAILVALASSPGRVFSRSELVNRARGYDFEGYERTVDSHVKNLRRKIEADPSEPTVILTVVGVGYRLGITRDA